MVIIVYHQCIPFIHWFILVSIVYSDWQWFSKVSGQVLSQPSQVPLGFQLGPSICNHATEPRPFPKEWRAYTYRWLWKSCPMQPVPLLLCWSVFRNGDLLSPPFRLILNKSTLQEWSAVLSILSIKANLRTGAVRRWVLWTSSTPFACLSLSSNEILWEMDPKVFVF